MKKKEKTTTDTKLTKYKLKQLKEKKKENTRLIKLSSLHKKDDVLAKEIVSVKKLNKSYFSGKIEHKVLKNISLSINKGDFVVILGPSGSGKTTLLNILSGLDKATSGKVNVCGNNLTELSSSELTTFRRNNVGFVFQSYNLLSELNVEDNVRMGHQLQIDGNKRLDIFELFERVGLKGLEKNMIGELSGGQMQRVSIVRALAKNPDIIFADEPTGALDQKTSEKVLNLFKEINEKYNTTIVLVTHDEAIRNMAKTVISVIDGKVEVEKR